MAAPTDLELPGSTRSCLAEELPALRSQGLGGSCWSLVYLCGVGGRDHSFWPFSGRRSGQPGKGGSLGLCLPGVRVLVSSFQMRVRFSLCLLFSASPPFTSGFHTFLHCGESSASNLGMFWSENIWLIPVDLGAVSILQAAQCLLH